MAIRKGVVGIVYKKDGGIDSIRFLVMHRIWLWKGWEFPKGGVERSDRTEESAVLREVMEETGLMNARVTAKIPYEIKYDYPRQYTEKFNSTGAQQSVFLVRTFTDDVIISEAPQGGAKEHDEFQWLGYEKAREILTHEQQKGALDVAWKYLNKMEKNEQ